MNLFPRKAITSLAETGGSLKIGIPNQESQ